MGFAGKFKFSCALDFFRMGGIGNPSPGKLRHRMDDELMMNRRIVMRKR